jgi:hypothetical protein
MIEATMNAEVTIKSHNKQPFAPSFSSADSFAVSRRLIAP